MFDTHLQYTNIFLRSRKNADDHYDLAAVGVGVPIAGHSARNGGGVHEGLNDSQTPGHAAKGAI